MIGVLLRLAGDRLVVMSTAYSHLAIAAYRRGDHLSWGLFSCAMARSQVGLIRLMIMIEREAPP